MVKKYVLLVLAVLIAVSTFTVVKAETPIAITYQIVQDITTSEGTAEYSMTLANNDNYQHTVLLSGSPSYWLFTFEKDKVILRPYEEKTISLTVRPPKDIRIGSHLLKINAKEKSGAPLGAATIKVNIDSMITPLHVTLDLQKEITPAERVPFSMIVENRDIRTLGDIKVTFSSSLFDMPYEFKVDSLRPLETKTVQGDVIAKAQSPAGVYKIYMKGIAGTRPVSSSNFQVTVLKKPLLDVQKQTESSFLTSTHVATIKNLGNAEFKGSVYSAEFVGLERFFISADPSPATISKTVVEGKNADKYDWDATLAEGASTTITYSVSYIWPFAAAIVLVFLIVLFFHRASRQGLEVDKSIVQSRESKDGPKALRIQLTIKNHSNKNYKNVVLEDVIPTPMRLVEEFNTAEPAVVKQSIGLTKIVWKFDGISAKEELIVMYGLRAGLKVIGKITLPPAKITYLNKDRLVEEKSNSVYVASY